MGVGGIFLMPEMGSPLLLAVAMATQYQVKEGIHCARPVPQQSWKVDEVYSWHHVCYSYFSLKLTSLL